MPVAIPWKCPVAVGGLVADDIVIAPLGAGKAELPGRPAGHLSCHTRPWRHATDG
jgi:hypothetical protein